MDWKDKIGRANKLFEEATAILQGENVSAEDLEKAENMFTEAKSMQAQGARLKEIMDLSALHKVADKEPDVLSEGEPTEPKPKEKKEAPEPSEWKSWNEFVFRAWQGSIGVERDERLTYFRDEIPAGEEKKQMSGQTGAAGGFLIPMEFYPTVMGIAAEESIVRSRATIIRMRRRQIQIPVVDQTSTTPGQAHWFGGMKFYWLGEGVEKLEEEPKFRQAQLTAHKLVGLTHASDELLDDTAVSIGDFLSGPLGFAGGVAWMEDFAFLMGIGGGQPRGIVNAPATLAVARGTAGAVTIPDLANMMAAFLPTGRGVWVLSQSVMASMIQMAGPVGNPYYFWQPSLREGVPGRLFGLPVIWTEKVPLLGTRGDVGLYDFRYYVLGDRQATTVESSKGPRWVFDQTSWRVVHRVDGRPWLSAPITLQDGNTQVSPFVVLDGEVSS